MHTRDLLRYFVVVLKLIPLVLHYLLFLHNIRLGIAIYPLVLFYIALWKYDIITALAFAAVWTFLERLHMGTAQEVIAINLSTAIVCLFTNDERPATCGAVRLAFLFLCEKVAPEKVDGVENSKLLKSTLSEFFQFVSQLFHGEAV